MFGGTFDPPHYGHLSLLRAAIAAVQPTAVYVIPTGEPPHKAAGHTPAALRMEMCACFLPLFEGLILDDSEILRGGKSYTVDTVHAVQKKFPDSQIYLPMGSDMFLSFTQWREWREIIKCAVLVVHCRDDEDEPPVHDYVRSLRTSGAEILLTEGRIMALSSTEIREKAMLGEDICALVPPEAFAVIQKNLLYAKKEKK